MKNIIKVTLKTVYRYKISLLFLALWAHVSLLNLFFISYNGPVFLWKENSELLTIQVHLLIAFIGTVFYLLVSKLTQHKKTKHR